jgi:WD40 repeat protein
MNKMLKASEAFEDDITSLAWSPDGKLIACGDRESKVITLDATTLALIDQKSTHVTPKIKMKQTGTQWVEDIKFSPDGKYIAFGHHGY